MFVIIHTILQFIAGGIAVYLVLSELYRQHKNLSFVWTVWKRFRISMFLQTFVLIIVIFSALMLLNKHVPFLKYGWLNLITKNGGNIILAPVVAGVDSPYLLLRIFPPIFLFFLLLCVPFFAETEEKIFRRGFHTWGKMIRQSIYFGLFHLTVGISVSVALVLIIPGFFLVQTPDL